MLSNFGPNLPAKGSFGGLPEELPVIDKETLVIWGTSDTAFDTDKNLEGISDYVKKDKLSIKKVPNTSHWVCLLRRLLISYSNDAL